MVVNSSDSDENLSSGMAPNEFISTDELIVDLDGFEGPLDLLLTLSRTQKLDLMQISILQLAEQYLEFVEKARSLRIELAADYLVMAAWLAYLKSRLLLPSDPDESGPTGEELAAHLAFQLERLQAMRDVAAKLMARDQLGRDFFARGFEEKVENFTYSGIEWRAITKLKLNIEQNEKIVEILTSLEELDDVQNIFTNAKLEN